MVAAERRARDRAARHVAILGAAREIAEAEGWDAVTTRRLAERIEYSQPVLYSHFAGKDAIVDAVALEGFADLAAELRRAASTPATGAAVVASEPDRRGALTAVVHGYLRFARAHPAVYAAMFTRPTALPFATPDTPAELLAGFAALRDLVAPAARDPHEAELRAELLWSTLHGLATLTAADRVRRDGEDDRIALLVRSVLGPPA